jgi:uncharacterized membrane protein
MGKLKDAHIFSNEKGSVAKFFVTAATYAAAIYASNILTSLIEKEPFKWGESLLVILIIVALITAVYFITRLLAYHTKVFPNTDNREGLHGVSFIFLMILSIILLLVFA